MQTNSGNRWIRVGWTASALLLALGIVALVLYGTGAFDSWRDARSLDRACGGALAQKGLEAALGTSDPRGESHDTERGLLAQCSVKTAGSGTGKALDITLRWSNETPPSGSLAAYSEDYNGFKGQAAPLGNGWSGVVRHDGTTQIMVALDCRNQKSKALVAYGDLYGETNSGTLAGLGRVTAETAQRAAQKHDCQVQAGEPLVKVSTAKLGDPDTAEPLKQAQGSCASLRDLARTAAQNGVPEVMEYPTDTHAPQTNCYLVTSQKKPGFGLYAYYGASAKDFLRSEGDQLKQGTGPIYGDKDYAWATASCPQSTQRAVFVLYHLYDRATDSPPITHYSAEFATSALKAFATHEAETRGCTDVRMAS
ncbi:hypothetical protein JS756_29875 [Streptomyces actuosus]|uniref:Uncharacterized protein n=1 Tax=Streptomyces actuosus TaxID=1885 RepID=A0ABS2VZ35_STRAS|nr:hypothetical protein [Streptomyces actuosus]MBN0048245.1 hypothetical protein [Streptomyces actuosus]